MAITTYTASTAILSAVMNANLQGLADGTNDTPNNSLVTTRLEMGVSYVSAGVVWSIVSALNGTMTAGTLYVAGQRVPMASISSHAFTASKDTYIDINSAGVITYVEVANGATSPALTTSSIRVAKVVTSGVAITSVTRAGIDSQGNYIYNTSPTAAPITVFTNAGTAGGTFYSRTQDGIKEVWGKTGSIAVVGTGFQASASKTILWPSGFFSAPPMSFNMNTGTATNSQYVALTTIGEPDTAGMIVQLLQSNGSNGTITGAYIYARGV
jgi:hypothetical protein